MTGHNSPFSLCVVFLVLLVCHYETAWATPGLERCMSLFPNGAVPMQPSKAVQVCRENVIGISYDVVMVNPAWSASHVTPAQARQHIPGRMSFYEDPDLKSMGVHQAEEHAKVFNTTWNKGHLTPNAIMSYSNETKHSTFTMANVAPQFYTFNQQPWAHLELAVSDWIASNSTALYIVTGIAYTNRANPRRQDGIAIPDYYFKVVCDTTNHQSAGFFGRNDESFPHDVANDFHTVKQVEQLYGGSLFPSDACNTGVVNPSHWWRRSIRELNTLRNRAARRSL